MARVRIGRKVPWFSIPATGDAEITPDSLKGQPAVLYFYPKDGTPGCTAEGLDFRNHYSAFEKLGVRVFGVSRDSLDSHRKFKARHRLPFDLISDADEELCRLFDVIRPKNLYGRKVMGIERSTFLLDENGVLRREWRKVKVDGHVAEVLDAARSL
jgi:peroxiredoxin Q/BCP